MQTIERVESGPKHSDRTSSDYYWTVQKIKDVERRQREAFEGVDLMDEVDDECAKLAASGKALELGLLLVKRAEAAIQRRINMELS